ncbi:oleate hydratase [Streptomyces sp. NPDC056660]|uniref:oleate hydratase n=1 Tax=Streptomyces sp. NPDC056660 TaxID=3345897 RepID=UPI0036A29DBD
MRPKVIPDGCVNLAFLGQYVELPDDVVFTVGTSVRTAMMAVWGLTGLEKPMVPMPQPYYDVRVLADNVKMVTGTDITADTLHTLVAGGSGREATASEALAPTR